MVQTIGPYSILRELGQGGMGRVALGEHVSTGEQVALKTVRVKEAGLLASIRREIHALELIRHPGVVRIKDHGLEEGIPWYAMELVPGQTLREVAARLLHSPDSSQARTLMGTASEARPSAHPSIATAIVSPRPPTTQGRTRGVSIPGGAVDQAGMALPAEMRPRILAVIRRLCEALAYLHGEGIVHRDLKPDNDIVRPDGMPVLVDFGLVTTFDPSLWRETLDVSADGSGTLAYMAPEQALRRPVDARADLYALGCILYELLTGRPPFYGETTHEILQKHQKTPPIPPSHLVPDLPFALDALCIALLAKAPRDRIGHADMVASTLATIGAGDDVVGPKWGPPAKAYLYRPGLAGREAILARVSLPLGRLGAPTPPQGAKRLLIGGESGVGKTRLLMAVAAEAHRRRVPVVACECLPPSGNAGAAPLSAFTNLFLTLADRCRERGVAETDHLLGKRGGVLSQYHEALRGLPGQDAYPELVELPSDAARRRILTSLTTTVNAFAEPSGLCLIVDDLQWADQLSIDAIAHLVTVASSSRVLLIGSFRTEEQSEAISRLHCPDDVTLGLLDASAVKAMVGDMLGVASPPAPLMSFLGIVSQGNPFYVAEYLRTAVHEGLLHRDGAGQWQLVGGGDPTALRSPSSLRGLVSHRLWGLSDLAGRVTGVAATLGREMEIPVLGAAAALPERDLLSALAELVARQILEDAPGGRMRFIHDKLHEVAYSRIPVESRREIHRAVAAALEEAGTEIDRQHATLGHHWAEAGEPAKAEAHLIAGARESAKRYAARESEALYRAALDLPLPLSRERAQARFALANGMFIASRMGEAYGIFERALEEARALGDRTLERLCLKGLPLVGVLLGKVDEARAHVAALRALVPQEPRERAVTLSNLALALQYLNQVPEAIGAYEESLALMESDPGAERLLVTLRLNLGSCLSTVGRTAEALATLDAALPVAQRFGDRSLLAFHHLAVGRLSRGRLQDSLEQLRQSAAIFHEIEHHYYEAVALGSIGENLLHLGRLEEARRSFEAALALHRELGNSLDAMHDVQRLGMLAFCQGDVARALELHQEALTTLRKSGDLRGISNTCAFLVDLFRAAGSPEDARRAHEESVAAAAKIPDDAVRAIADLHLAALERESGRLATAKELLTGAEPPLRRYMDRPLLVRLECELGHLALSLSESADGRALAREHLDRAQALERDLAVEAGSSVGRMVARLAAAVQISG